LRLLAKSGQTVPPDFLPLLLDLGKRERDLRSAILPILGNRGHWLTNQNSNWKYAIDTVNLDPNPIELQEIWMTGTRTERAAALTKWRQIQPIESCLAVAASWKQDKADDRLAWLEILQTNLSLADEEFLEIALFDRSEPVRHLAADLLRQLPSRYRQRLTELASKCLTIKEKKNNKYQIEINLSPIHDKEWQAAGVSNNMKPESKLLQVISAADLDIWMGDIDRLINAAMIIPYEKEIVITGLVKAACSQRRTDWIEALLNRAYPLLGINQIQQLVGSFAGDNSEFLTNFFTNIFTPNESIDNLDVSLHVITNCFHISTNRYCEWSPEISNLAIQHFDRYIQKLIVGSNSYYYQQQNLANLYSRFLDISVIPEIEQMQSKLSLENFTYSYFLDLMKFRRDMRSTFNTA
ncbi:DUF5691 domain-containing protein, partial [Chamaesiphon sp. VAR_48_metabat_403]|uniref:DUF5691 domain-containing protein n=1 Tax=Chamaesiphon sp. VAR_48_metabat_403 TaxID=2964700 RepID=UPI00286E1B78